MAGREKCIDFTKSYKGRVALRRAPLRGPPHTDTFCWAPRFARRPSRLGLAVGAPLAKGQEPHAID